MGASSGKPSTSCRVRNRLGCPVELHGPSTTVLPHGGEAQCEVQGELLLLVAFEWHSERQVKVRRRTAIRNKGKKVEKRMKTDWKLHEKGLKRP